jgi:hypothetical protein
MSNFKLLQYKGGNKDNFNKTPLKILKSKSDVFIEETPTPNIRKKVLKTNSNLNVNNPFVRKKVLDTPTNTQRSQKKTVSLTNEKCQKTMKKHLK